jgi:hypothetical protein
MIFVALAMWRWNARANRSSVAAKRLLRDVDNDGHPVDITFPQVK